MEEGSVRRKKHPIRILLLVLAGLVILLWLVFHFFYRQSNYVSDSDVQVHPEELGTELVLEALQTEIEEDETEGQSVTYDLSGVQPVQASRLEHVYSLVMIGYEQQETGAEVMVLVTINGNTHQIFLQSFSPDLVAQIPEAGLHRLADAYTAGAGPLLVETLEENYGIHIDHYVAIDFGSMAQIVDLFDGLEAEVPEEELERVNDRIREMCMLQGEDPEGRLLTQAGWQHLDGIQAIACARCFGQREILAVFLHAVGEQSKAELLQLLQDVLSRVTHNLKPLEILSLAATLAGELHDEMVTEKLPYEGLTYEEGDLLIPQMPETAHRLQETIYGAATEAGSEAAPEETW